MTSTRFAIALLATLLSTPAYAVTGNASVDNPGQTTDDNPGQTTGTVPEGRSELGDAGSAVRWSPERKDYNLIPSHKCVSMVCDKVQGGDR